MNVTIQHFHRKNVNQENTVKEIEKPVLTVSRVITRLITDLLFVQSVVQVDIVQTPTVNQVHVHPAQPARRLDCLLPVLHVMVAFMLIRRDLLIASDVHLVSYVHRHDQNRKDVHRIYFRVKQFFSTTFFLYEKSQKFFFYELFHFKKKKN